MGSYLIHDVSERAAIVAQAGAMILPGARLDCLAYGCMSRSLLVEQCAIMGAVQKSRPGVPYLYAAERGSGGVQATEREPRGAVNAL